jgi:formylglycine-generating enzyme required for sulfatase activity
MPYIKNQFVHSSSALLSILLLTVILFADFSISYCRDGREPATVGKWESISTESFANPQQTHMIPSINYRMVYISPGTFIMGSPPSEKGRYDDEMQHRVTLTKGFFMGVTEVTIEQWKKVMGYSPSQSEVTGKTHPVEMVSWNECQAFIMKVNKLEKSRRYRLPTEAEWEYACRADSGLAFSNGGIVQAGCGLEPSLDRIGWYCGNTTENTQPVAKKEPNAWGLYDMHGNAWEWCQDWYAAYPPGHIKDPKGPVTGVSRVFRSGGWGLSARSCRSAFRDKYAPDLKCRFLGLRLVYEAGK